MKKKGISPLIATVLLIGFTISLATVAIVWGNDLLDFFIGLSEKKLEEIDCLGFTDKIDIKSSCIISDKVRLVIKNDNSQNITSFLTKIYGVETMEDSETESGIEPNSLGEIKSKFSPDTMGIPKRIEIRPVLTNGKRTVCKEFITYQISEESCYKTISFEEGEWNEELTEQTDIANVGAGITIISSTEFELNSKPFYIPLDVKYIYFYANIFVTERDVVFTLKSSDSSASQELLREQNIIWNKAIEIEESLKGKEVYISVIGPALKTGEYVELAKICFSDEGGMNCII